LQVLSDSNGDFAVIGICSANAASSSIVAALGSLLSGQQQQAATAAAAAPGSLQGLRMHVSELSSVPRSSKAKLYILCTLVAASNQTSITRHSRWQQQGKARFLLHARPSWLHMPPQLTI
jgi:hypothetical protein